MPNSQDDSKQSQVHMKGRFTGWVQKNESFFRIIEVGLLVLAIGLSILNTFTTANFNTAVVSHLTSLDTLFASVENGIEELPKSIAKFDSTVDKMTISVEKSQKELVREIGGLEAGVHEFSEGLVSYETMLKEIVQASDKQLELLRKTQAQWEEEISRMPKLELYAEKVDKISDDTLQVFLRIRNIGNQIAENCRMVLEVPLNFVFIATGWTSSEITSERGIVSWSYPTDPIDIIHYYDRPGLIFSMSRLLMNFKLRVPPNAEFPLKFHYIIWHKRGYEEGDLLINP